jgi:hypothetical protein
MLCNIVGLKLLVLPPFRIFNPDMIRISFLRHHRHEAQRAHTNGSLARRERIPLLPRHEET